MNKKTKIAKDENSIKQEASKKTPELKKKKWYCLCLFNIQQYYSFDSRRKW